MRSLLLALVALPLSCISVQPCPCEPFSPLPQALKVSSRWGSGTAFPISDTDFLTAWHVVEQVQPADTLSVGTFLVDEIIPLVGLDAALLRVSEGHGLSPWILSERGTPARGEPLWISGWGSGFFWQSKGYGTGDEGRASLSIAPGDSGSPLLDRRGEVRGLVVGVGWNGQHHAFFMPIDDIVEAMKLVSHSSAYYPTPLER